MGFTTDRIYDWIERQGVEYADDKAAFDAELALRFGIEEGSFAAYELRTHALDLANGKRVTERVNIEDIPAVSREDDTPPSLNVEWLQDALDETPPEPEWLWKGYIARGFTTLLVGLAKTGKTTLLCGLLQEFADGGFLLDREVADGAGALILTEQNAMVFRSTIDNFGFGFDPERVAVAFLPKQHPALGWDAKIDDAIETCRESKLDLLVVDTFARWASFERDNDSPEILRAMQAIDRAKSAGLAVLIVHHARKAGGEHTEDVSGPVSLAGGVDIVLSLRRAGEGRVLAADGRSMESPPRVMFGLTPFEGFAVVDAQDAPSLNALIVDALCDGPLGYTELVPITGRSNRAVRDAVYELVRDGTVIEAPKLGRAKRYALAS